MSEGPSNESDKAKPGRLLLGVFMLAFFLAIVAVGVAWAFASIVDSIFASVLSRAFVLLVLVNAALMLTRAAVDFWWKEWRRWHRPKAL